MQALGLLGQASDRDPSGGQLLLNFNPMPAGGNNPQFIQTQQNQGNMWPIIYGNGIPPNRPP